MKVKLLSDSPEPQPNSSHHLHQYQSGGSAMIQWNPGGWRSWLLVMWTLKLENGVLLLFIFMTNIYEQGFCACALCVFACESRHTVCAYVHVGGCMCKCVHADTRGWYVSHPQSLCLIHWGRVSLLSGSQAVLNLVLDGAASLPAPAPGFVCLCLLRARLSSKLPSFSVVLRT